MQALAGGVFGGKARIARLQPAQIALEILLQPATGDPFIADARDIVLAGRCGLAQHVANTPGGEGDDQDDDDAAARPGMQKLSRVHSLTS